MHWTSSENRRQEHRQLINQVVDWWLASHSDETLDYTKAAEEWCKIQGLPADYLSLGKNGKIPTKAFVEQVGQDNMEACPFCGARLEFEVLPACDKVNPKHFSALIACPNEECSYYFYTTEPIVDVYNKISNGNFSSVNKVFV